MTKINDRHHTVESKLRLLAILPALLFMAACSKAPTTPPPVSKAHCGPVMSM